MGNGSRKSDKPFCASIILFLLILLQNKVETNARSHTSIQKKIPFKLQQIIFQVHGGHQYNNQNSNNQIYQMKQVTLYDIEEKSYIEKEQSHSLQTASSYPSNLNHMYNNNNMSTRTTKVPSIFKIITSYIQQLHALSPTLSIFTISSVVVFILWQSTSLWGRRGKNHLLALLQNHFVCSKYTILRQNHFHASILASVSHISFTHLAFNLYMFLSLGKQLYSSMSPLPLWPVVIGSSLIGSISFLTLTPQNSNNSGGCLGLSGVTSSFFCIYALRYPARILHMRLPWPLWLLFPDTTVNLAASHVLQLFSGMTLFSVFFPWVFGSSGRTHGGRASTKNIAHATHLGGLLFGLIYVELWKHGYLRKIAYSKWGGRSVVWKSIDKACIAVGSLLNQSR